MPDCQPRLADTPLETAVEILRAMAEFHRRLVSELIDDSEGDRVFGTAHLQALLADLRAHPGVPVVTASTDTSRC